MIADLDERRIYVSREKEDQYRLFSLDTARGYLRTGLIKETDLAWCDGMADWAPLAKVIRDIENNTIPKSSKPSRLTVSPHKLGDLCFRLGTSFQDAYTRTINQLGLESDSIPTETESGLVWTELFYLGFFVVDYAIQESLTGPTREAALKSYRSHLFRIKLEGNRSFRPIKTRLLVYNQTARVSDGRPADRRIGALFARFCGDRNNKRLNEIGSTLFHNVYNHVLTRIQAMEVEPVR